MTATAARLCPSVYTDRPQNVDRFLAASPINTIRANFYLALVRAGTTEASDINAAYAAFLPTGGEEALARAFLWAKVKYLPFVGFLLARYNPQDYNIKGTIKEYVRLYQLDYAMTTYRDMHGCILAAYNRLMATDARQRRGSALLPPSNRGNDRGSSDGKETSGDPATEPIDLAGWGQAYWENKTAK